MNVRTGSKLKSLVGREGYINSLAFSPDGSILASGARDNKIKLWDIRTGQSSGHSQTIRAVSLMFISAPMGTRLPPLAPIAQSGCGMWGVAASYTKWLAMRAMFTP